MCNLVNNLAKVLQEQVVKLNEIFPLIWNRKSKWDTWNHLKHFSSCSFKIVYHIAPVHYISLLICFVRWLNCSKTTVYDTFPLTDAGMRYDRRDLFFSLKGHVEGKSMVRSPELFKVCFDNDYESLLAFNQFVFAYMIKRGD